MKQQMEHYTNKKDLPKQVMQVISIADDLFGKQIFGIYLYGSSTLGGLRPDSDIDILIIANQKMADEVRESLTKQLLDISGFVGCAEKRPLEVTILSALKERGTAFHEIVMITIATYTFTKITIAIVGTVKTKQSTSPVLKTLRNISLADACVLIYTMQRSMLVTFPGMKAAEIQLFNILTGTTVWIIILFLGMNLIGGKRIDMAKSKSLKL